jgi:sirohydrochlorin ferrochelatase
MAPVTERHGQAVLVAHGQPSDPAPQDAIMGRLADSVAKLLPGWSIKGATLAMEGSFEAALRGFDRPIIYPFFMAEGVFTGQMLPGRLAALAPKALQVAPFGKDPALPALMARAALEGARSHRLDPVHTTLLLAAHGSRISPTSKDSALDMVRKLTSLTSFRQISAGFIEEAPFLEQAAHGLGPAICLPFFALRAGHVETDVPRALADAGFSDPLLSAIGEHAGVPMVIADALVRARLKVAA